MKTPEQMAEEYAETVWDESELTPDDKAIERHVAIGKHSTKIGFLAGYQAGKEAMLNIQSRMDGAIDRMFQRATGNSSNNSNGWISVKERLPNLEKTSRSLRRESSCILLVSYGNVYVAHLCEDWTDRSHFIFEACTCNCRAFDMDIDEWKLDQVTHWMPLPKPPEDK